ncbi:SCO family protein [Iodidimonas gelatinilytica]|nr:SCO family protein [Iodidimonas gelatinilytica]
MSKDMPKNSRRGMGLLILGVAIILAVGFSFYMNNRSSETALATNADALPEADMEVDLDAPVGGPFILTGTDGKPVSADDFRGKYMLMVFGYTFCPDVCPMSLLAVSNALYDMEKKYPDLVSAIEPVFVTLDPERDTPDALSDYLQSFHPRITGLTGTLPDIKRMATAYAVRFSKTEADEYSTYLIDHSTNIMLMGPDGAYLTHFSPQTPPGLMASALASRVKRKDS